MGILGLRDSRGGHRRKSCGRSGFLFSVDGCCRKVSISYFLVFIYVGSTDGEDGASYFYVFICSYAFFYPVGKEVAKFICTSSFPDVCIWDF